MKGAGDVRGRNHRRFSGRLVVALLAVLASLGGGCEQQALERQSRRGNDALVRRATLLETQSYAQAAAVYEQLLQGTQELSPSAEVGPFTVAQLRRHAADIRERALAESSVLQCALWSVAQIAEPVARLRLIAGLVVALDGAPPSLELVQAAQEDLELIAEDQDRAMARARLVPLWEQLGETEEAARELASIDERDGLARVVALLGQAGLKRRGGDLAGADRSLQLAHDVLQTMDRQAREFPWALSELAAAYAKVERGVETRRILGDLQGARERVRAMIAVSDAYRDTDKPGAASYWLDEALEETTRTDTPYALAMALAETAGGHMRAREGRRARALLDQALEVARNLDILSSERAGALSKVARKYAALGEREQAMMIADVLLEDGSRDQAWARAGVAVALAENGRFDEAVPVVFSIPKLDVRRVTLAGILVAAVASGAGEKPPETFVLHRILREFG